MLVFSMTDNMGFGHERRRALNLDVLNGQRTFRDAFREMLDSVSERHTFQECQETLKKSQFLYNEYECPDLK